MVKKYAVVEVKKGDCIFRQFDTFEQDYFCNHDKVWLDSKNDCKGCKFKDSGESKQDLINKVKTAISRNATIGNFGIEDDAQAVIDFLGIKE